MARAKIRPSVRAVVRKLVEASRDLDGLMFPMTGEYGIALTLPEVRAIMDACPHFALAFALARLEADAAGRPAEQPKRHALSLVKGGA